MADVRPYRGTRWRAPDRPRTVEAILSEFRHAHRFAIYGTAGRVAGVRRQADADAFTSEYATAVRDVAIRAAFELQDLGVDDDAIVDRLREAMAA